MKNFLFILSIFFSISTFSQTQKENFLHANAFFQRNFYDSATIYFEKCISQKFNEVFCLEKCAEIYFSQKNFEKTKEFLEKIEKLESGRASYKLAQLFAKTGNIEKCIENLKKHLSSHYKLPESQIKTDKIFAKIENSQQWKQLWKNDWYSKTEIQLANAAYSLKTKNFSDAFEILDALIRKNRKEHRAYFLRSKVYSETQDFESALNDIEKAIDIQPNKTEYLNAKFVYFMELKKFKQALNILENLEKKNFLELNNFYLKALVEKELQLFDSAQVHIEKYLFYLPENEEGLFLCGKIFFDSENYIDALKYFNVCLKLYPKPKYYLFRAETYLKTETYTYAITDFSMVLDYEPNNSEIYLQRAAARLKNQDRKGACSDWKKAKNLGNPKAEEFLLKFCE